MNFYKKNDQHNIGSISLKEALASSIKKWEALTKEPNITEAKDACSLCVWSEEKSIYQTKDINSHPEIDKFCFAVGENIDDFLTKWREELKQIDYCLFCPLYWYDGCFKNTSSTYFKVVYIDEHPQKMLDVLLRLQEKLKSKNFFEQLYLRSLINEKEFDEPLSIQLFELLKEKNSKKFDKKLVLFFDKLEDFVLKNPAAIMPRVVLFLLKGDSYERCF